MPENRIPEAAHLDLIVEVAAVDDSDNVERAPIGAEAKNICGFNDLDMVHDLSDNDELMFRSAAVPRGDPRMLKLADLAGYVNGKITAKRCARLVVGTSTAGWTAADCDYLCHGANDNEKIQAAISALPTTGGEVVILDGIYSLNTDIFVNNPHVILRGNGSATMLRGADVMVYGNYCTLKDITLQFPLNCVYGNHCTVENVWFTNDPSDAYTDNLLCIAGIDNRVINCDFEAGAPFDADTDEAYASVYISGDGNVVVGNVIRGLMECTHAASGVVLAGNTIGRVALSGTHHIVTGNVITGSVSSAATSSVVANNVTGTN